jgi:oligoendopeptidase F
VSNNTQTQDVKESAKDIVWDLKDLFTSLDDPKIPDAIRDSEKKASEFVTKYKQKLDTLNGAEINQAYQELEEIWAPLYKVSQFVSLESTLDTSDDKIKAMVDFVDEVESRVANMTLFFGLEISAFSEDHLTSILQEETTENYQYSLKRYVETARFNLSEKEEQLSNLKDLTGESAFKKLYGELTSSYQFEIEVDGVERTMNGSELRALRYHKDPKVRRKAMKLFYKQYEDDSLVITQIYNSILKSNTVERDLRGYKSDISVRNIQNDIDDEVIDVLHDTTRDAAPLVSRYYKIKAKLLDLPDFSLADIYAPMEESPKKYTWDEAKDLVLQGFAHFDDEFYSYAKLMFDENRIHAPIMPKKRGGAFCSSSTPDINPYVMVNFLGKPRDVSTLAHELGHAIHDIYCSKQTLFNYHPILPLAETASVFSEMLVTDLLLSTQTDKAVKKQILTEKLEDIFATSHRQNMFSNFERETHEKIGKNRLSTQELCTIYQEQLKLMFQDSVVYPDEYKWEWSAIPHIFEAPFYVYAYNFGNLLVIALYQQYKEEGPSFVPKLKAMLSEGSSCSPREITELAGIDISKPDFWKKSFVYIEGLVTQLESLI